MAASPSKAQTPVKNIKKEISLNPDKCDKLVARYRRMKLDAQSFLDATDPMDQGGFTPLHEVMRICHGNHVLDLVEYIVETHPTSVETKDANGNLPIHVLPRFLSAENKKQIQLDQIQARRFLLSKHPESIKTKNNRGKTPLSKAIMFEYNILVQTMLDDNETLLTQPDEDGKVPLNHAMENFSISTVKMFLEQRPDDILTIAEFPKGDLEERQQLLAAIGHAIPETFDTECEASEEGEEGEWQLSSNLIRQFLSEAKLEQWGQDVIWRMMKSSVYRNRQAFPQKIEALSKQLQQEKKRSVAHLEETISDYEEKLNQLKIANERTRQELKVSKAMRSTVSMRLKQHETLAQEQETKYIELAMKVQSLQEARNFNSESKYFAKVDTEKWTVEELKAVLQSLIQRLNYLIPEHTKLSMAHVAGSYLAQDEHADKAMLIDTIEALNKELLEL
ncbi:unnamed protein product [Cylindrotheca closterium]|uniref:Uncharacterized protein n=1 Tax=Cylindrotheca closterium TaxID=2856 RepID=A0AAD2G9R5_9STRA|nr:unnamed protein product [Cylindrotheca closterium]